MTDLGELKRVARAAAETSLASTNVVDIDIQPHLNDDGEDLLRIRIIVPDEEADGLDFDQFFDAVLKIKDSVRRSGDERRAMVGFITPSELRYLADPEP